MDDPLHFLRMQSCAEPSRAINMEGYDSATIGYAPVGDYGKNGYTNAPNEGLTHYENREAVHALDENDVYQKPVSVFPYDIYKHQPFHTAYYACDIPRDVRSHYLLYSERMHHPAMFSRFGYAENWNGYGVGIWSGGKYRTSDECCANSFDPPGMAPAKYYDTSDFASMYSTKSQAYEDYDFYKTYGYG